MTAEDSILQPPANEPLAHPSTRYRSYNSAITCGIPITGRPWGDQDFAWLPNGIVDTGDDSELWPMSPWLFHFEFQPQFKLRPIAVTSARTRIQLSRSRADSRGGQAALSKCGQRFAAGRARNRLAGHMMRPRIGLFHFVAPNRIRNYQTFQRCLIRSGFRRKPAGFVLRPPVRMNDLLIVTP
jgi:hypothetical protein